MSYAARKMRLIGRRYDRMRKVAYDVWAEPFDNQRPRHIVLVDKSNGVLGFAGEVRGNWTDEQILAATDDTATK